MPSLLLQTLLAVATSMFLVPRLAAAQPPFAAPAPPPPAPPAPETPPAPPPAPAPPVVPTPPTFETDHDAIVGHWGIEARHLGTFLRSPGNDLACDDKCQLALNAISVRKWSKARYAWSAGLALGAGGGSRNDAGTIKTWDTYLGFGPTLGANFLLRNWKHVAVSFSPQLDALLFMPRNSGPKTFLVNVRGLLEAELHLGFIGLPELSVGTASGLVANYTTISKSAMTATGTASTWNVGFSGPQSLWGLVTNLYLRFYL